jgi:hypothetical protein
LNPPIINGDVKEISKLSAISEENQTDNIKYYKIRTTKKLLKTERARVTDNDRRCENVNGPQDLKLIAHSIGSSGFYYNSSNNTYPHTASLKLDMLFLRKTWYGAWVNHRSQSYSSSGTWYGYYSGLPAGHQPPSSSQPYSTGTNFSGEASSPSYYLWSTYYTLNYGDLSISCSIDGTQNFNFVDITCQTP